MTNSKNTFYQNLFIGDEYKDQPGNILVVEDLYVLQHTEIVRDLISSSGVRTTTLNYTLSGANVTCHFTVLTLLENIIINPMGHDYGLFLKYEIDGKLTCRYGILRQGLSTLTLQKISLELIDYLKSPDTRMCPSITHPLSIDLDQEPSVVLKLIVDATPTNSQPDIKPAISQQIEPHNLNMLRTTSFLTLLGYDPMRRGDDCISFIQDINSVLCNYVEKLKTVNDNVPMNEITVAVNRVRTIITSSPAHNRSDKISIDKALDLLESYFNGKPYRTVLTMAEVMPAHQEDIHPFAQTTRDFIDTRLKFLQMAHEHINTLQEISDFVSLSTGDVASLYRISNKSAKPVSLPVSHRGHTAA